MSEQKYIRVEDVQDNSIAAGLCDGQGNLYGADIVFCLSDIDNPVPTYTPAEIMAGMWVPVAERLPSPENDDWVLGIVTADIGALHLRDAITLVGYDPIEGWFLSEQPTVDVAVTHWMPLPQPPKEG